jgi:hypothetical protein
MRAVLYDVKWQLLRIGTLQARRVDGGWATLEGQRDNLETLRKYLDQPVAVIETNLRLYRVHNLLNAVNMGYNGQGADLELIHNVKDFKYVENTGDYDRYVINEAAAAWDWDKVYDELRLSRFEDRAFLLYDLGRRARKGTKVTRPELAKFLELLVKAS